MSNLDPELEAFVDAAPRVVAMLPIAAAPALAAIATAAGAILKAVAELATDRGFDARAAVKAADAAADLALALKFPAPAQR